MSTAGKLFRNGLMLSLAALLVQTAAMGFNVWLSGEIGAEGMGLFSLISAAYRFAMTFSLSGVGQSRLCMILLEKAHVGEVQVSVWPDKMVKACTDHGITLL